MLIIIFLLFRFHRVTKIPTNDHSEVNVYFNNLFNKEFKIKKFDEKSNKSNVLIKFKDINKPGETYKIYYHLNSDVKTIKYFLKEKLIIKFKNSSNKKKSFRGNTI